MESILFFLFGVSILVALLAAVAPPIAKLFDSKPFQWLFLAVWAAVFFDAGRKIFHETSVGAAIAVIGFWAMLQFVIPWMSRR